MNTSTHRRTFNTGFMVRLDLEAKKKRKDNIKDAEMAQSPIPVQVFHQKGILALCQDIFQSTQTTSKNDETHVRSTAGQDES